MSVNLPVFKLCRAVRDGTIIEAYPEEIIPSEMKDNGYSLEKIS